MRFESAVVFIALGWLVGSVILMARSIRKCRHLADLLATRYPEIYERLGCPRPGYFESVRRTRFRQFIGRREYENLPDHSLSAEFEEFRNSEARLVVSVLAIGALVAALALLTRHAA